MKLANNTTKHDRLKEEPQHDVWPPAPAIEQPPQPIKPRFTLGLVSLFLSMPSFIGTCLGVLRIKGVIHFHPHSLPSEIMGIVECIASPVLFPLPMVACVIGWIAWQSWTGKLGIALSLSVFLLPFLFPDYA